MNGNGNGNGWYYPVEYYAEPELVADPTFYTPSPYEYGYDIGYDPEPTYPVEPAPASDWPDWADFLKRLTTRTDWPPGQQAQNLARAASMRPASLRIQPAQQQMAMLPRIPGITTTGLTLRTAMRALLASISARVGQRVTVANVVALVKRVGVEATALALGITAAEVLQLYMMGTVKRRRRRGITGRQISNARSTIRRMTGFMRQVQEACSPAMRAGRAGRRRSYAHAPGCKCVACR